ncbi:hypothetical protein BTR22_07635 [Alkalihalophilus pseudofirmus]|nr:hypothetical protein BTR22_07635 [Alkalihalophilus pseudofirmus]
MFNPNYRWIEKYFVNAFNYPTNQNCQKFICQIDHIFSILEYKHDEKDITGLFRRVEEKVYEWFKQH